MSGSVCEWMLIFLVSTMFGVHWWMAIMVTVDWAASAHHSRRIP